MNAEQNLIDELYKLQDAYALLKEENQLLKGDRDNWHDQAKFGSNIIEQLTAANAELLKEKKKIVDFLEWNISSIKASPASREAYIQLEIYEDLLSKHSST